MLSLAQVKNSSVANVCGVNPNDPQFTAYVNEATNQLVKLGLWWGTVRAMVGVSYRGCMVWPTGVESVLAVNSNCRAATVANYWYEFLPMVSLWGDQSFGNGWNGNFNGGFGASVETWPNLTQTPPPVVRFSGTVPVFNPPTVASPFAVQVTADNAADYGKTITIYGKDTNGVEVVQLRSDGTTQRGVVLTLALAAPFTTVVFSEITAVIKDATIANVRLWVYNPANPLGVLVAIYQGAETNPEYLFSNMARTPNFGRIGTNCIQHIEALVKLSALPVAQDSDLLIIDNLDAIKSMIQSIRYRESGDDDNSIKSEKDAVRRLNAELRSRFPDQQVVARSNPVGTRIYSPI